ncbi:SRPBCC family protein [Nocardia lijiangensis]|uniref:SRPBCC family protein n=1 Tax=Nocardia lijiangensis TaxID=299618 RepID=UPI00082BA570|nr:SRPBCC family protein [Nocardia lijiangensis]
MPTKALGDVTRKVSKTATGVTSQAKKAAAPATPQGQLQDSLRNLTETIAERALTRVAGRVAGTADRLTQVAEGGGGNLLSALTGVEKLAEGKSPMGAAMSAGMDKLKRSATEKFQDVKESLTGGKGKGGGKKLKLTNIVEQIDVGVPITLAYDQWTQFADFPKFMKKVQQVEQVSDEKLEWSGKVFWSKRTWNSTILEQVPFERIVWRSKGNKGYIDGAVTFHELTPDLTRIMVVLEYHPGGVFEKTANLWRAAGRRVRLELKHFQRHVMIESVLNQDDIMGWHGEIRDKKVVKDDETARREEQEEAEGEERDEAYEDEERDEDEDEETDEDVERDEDDEDEERDEADEERDEFDEDEEAEEDERPARRPAARRRTTSTSRRTTSGSRRAAPARRSTSQRRQEA